MFYNFLSYVIFLLHLVIRSISFTVTLFFILPSLSGGHLNLLNENVVSSHLVLRPAVPLFIGS